MLQPQRILQNRYLIKQQIGAGGMGAVYLAEDRQTETVVAIKETISADLRLERAFEREAQLLSTLRHPALPRVMNYFTEEDGQYIVMEYIAGNDLSEIISLPEPYPVADVLRWADEILDALDYLHNQKIPVVHRDIKPHNLKLNGAGKIVLLDFGLAKGTPTELSKLTATKSIFGYSRNYAPLEQIQGKGTDLRSDLYALAATLYHLMTGEPPLDALTRATAIISGEEDLLRRADSANPHIPAAIAEILHQALALNPSVRPDSAVAMRFALRAAQRQEPVKAPAASVGLTRKRADTASARKTIYRTHVAAHNATVAPPPSSAAAPENQGVAGRKSVLAALTTPVRIAIALFFVCLLGLGISIFRSEPTKAVDSEILQQQNTVAAPLEKPLPIVETSPETAETAAQNEVVEEKPVETQTVAAAPDDSEKPVVAAPKKKTKTVAAREESENEPIVESRQPATPAPVQPAKRETVEVKKKEDKDGGFKGIINKIGDGAKKLNPFKKKKDKKNSD